MAVRFAFKDQGVHLQGRVSSEVIHIKEKGQEQIFGVLLETSLETFWIQLTPVIQALLEESNAIED